MTKIPNGFEVIQLFEQFSPKGLALEGDKIGLQIGSLNKPIHNVMVTLDVLENVVDEAIEKEVDLIIAHHPPIFRPLKHIDTDQVSGRLIEKCIKHDISVYAAHTNLDVAKGGVNDLLAEALQLQNTEVLVPTYDEPLKKLVVFVPESHANSVREAIGKAGAGFIGDYRDCSFSSNGKGRFLPTEGTNPFIGHAGEQEIVDEEKVESIFPESIQKAVISAMLKAHPYEEAAYDIIPLENKGETLGLGRIGELQQTMTLEQFAQLSKKALEVGSVRVVGQLDQPIKKVAVLGGDGNKYITQAKFKGADVYVTGDVYYHVAHDAMALGLSVVDVGHHAEKIMKKGVANYLTELFAEKKYQTNVIVSKANTDPFTFL